MPILLKSLSFIPISWSPVEMWWHMVTLEGEWRGNWRMECVASALHTTSEHGVSTITTADAHTSAVSSRLNWRPHQFKCSGYLVPFTLPQNMVYTTLLTLMRKTRLPVVDWTDAPVHLNAVGSQYPSHYLGTWCIQHYYRWCAHLGCQQSTELTPLLI